MAEHNGDPLDLSGIDWKQFFAKLDEEHTPNGDGSCKVEGCDGRIIKQVRSLFRGQYGYDIPKCEKCGRQYFRASNARAVGINAFNESLRTPMTF